MPKQSRVVTEGGFSEDHIDLLWKRYGESHDEQLRDGIITYYLPLVKYVVGRIAVGMPRFISFDDLYSTGVMGLMKAVDRYDCLRENTFETYAFLLIKGAIIDELRALDWVPRSVYKKIHQVEDAQNDFEQIHGREATDDELAAHLNMDSEELGKLLVRIRPAVMVSLDAERTGSEEGPSLAERIPDTHAMTSFQNAERNEIRKYLSEVIADFPEQERLVLSMYYYGGLMLKEIGKVLAVSESRVSQIHSKAIIRLRKRTKDIL